VTKAQIKLSLKYWRNRLARAERGLKRNPKAGDKHQFWLSRQWKAKRVIARRQKQLAAFKPLRVRAYEQAVKDLGILEQGGNNRGPAVEAIIRENGGIVGEPWCGDAVAHWYRQAGSKVVQRGWASTIWLLANLLRVKTVAKGHVVVYNFGSGGAKHTGLFERWAREVGPGWFHAIEGNTGKDSRSSDSTAGGDGVHRRLRHTSDVAGFRRVLK
jgi:hypothetical protein